jgi:pimeloyl-ACP methyl ester carboxylesterase
MRRGARESLCVALALGALVASSCSPTPKPAAPGVEVRMVFDRPDLYAAPFPSDDLRRDDGTIDLSGFPNPSNIALVTQSTALLARDARGFATTGGVFFSLTGAIDRARLPTMAESITPTASVFLVGIDDAATDYLKRYPIDVAFEADGGPFGAPNLLSLLPLQGIPLRPQTRYAAVVLRSIAEPQLVPSEAMRQLAGGVRPTAIPAAVFDEYQAALTALAANGVAPADVAGLTVFTTDAPLAAMERVRTDILARPLPVPGAFTQTDVFDEYCVYHTTIGFPDYQQGTPPFDTEGGDWAFDAAGNPVVQRTEEANLVVTVPRGPQPVDGFPTVVLIRTGAGGDRPLVDRGVQAVHGGPSLVPGSGPAQQFARAGFAGVQVDGPHGGLRNVTAADEQFLMFNIFNGAALRDNVRESAVELVLLAHILETLSLDASDCPGVGAAPVTLDTTRLALMGHSMGASIAPLVLAFEPRYRAVILSGAGGSWIENVMWKQQPLEVRPAIEFLLRYSSRRRLLTAHDPVLTLVQWAAEPADAVVYASRILSEPATGESPRHVLMIQGIVDHYIMPRIANALSLSLGLDLAGEALDSVTPEIADQTHLADVLTYSGRSQLALPATANFGGIATAIVVQQREDGLEDGHEVAFQNEPPRYEYKCFLESFARGIPSVPDGTGMTADAACPPSPP